MPRSCIDARGPRNPRAHRSRHAHAADLCASLAVRIAVRIAVPKPATACRSLSGLSGRPALVQACSCTTVIQRAKAGGMGCATAHMALPTRQRSTLCGCCELATLHSSCVERIIPHLLAGPPCSVARLPFLSSCARVRKRDEIMSVPIRTHTLHESRTRLVAGHRALLCVTATSSQASHEYAVHTVAGTPRQPPHGDECRCRVGTGVSGKGVTSSPVAGKAGYISLPTYHLLYHIANQLPKLQQRARRALCNRVLHAG